MQRQGELEEHERDRPALAAPLEDGQQLAVVRDRLVEGVLLPGPVAGSREVDRRPLLVLGAEPVVGEQAGDLVLAAGVLTAEPLGCLAVQPVPLFAHEGSVGRVLDQRVLEAELGFGPAPSLAQEVQPLELGESRTHLCRFALGDAFQQRQAELPPQHGRGHQGVVCRVGEPVDAGEDHLLHGGWDLHGHLVVEPPAAPVVANEGAGVGERPDDLLQEERVSLGRLQDAALGLGRQRAGSHEGVQQLATGITRQGVEGDLPDPVRQLPRHVLLEPPCAVVALGPSGHQQQERLGVGVGGQPLQELQRGGVRPVQVLDRDGDGSVSRQTGRQRAHDLERAVLQRLGRQLCQTSCDVGLQREAEQCAEVGVEVDGSVAEQLVEPTAERDPHPQLGLVAEHPEPRAQQVPQRPVGHRLAVRDAATHEPSGPATRW